MSAKRNRARRIGFSVFVPRIVRVCVVVPCCLGLVATKCRFVGDPVEKGKKQELQLEKGRRQKLYVPACHSGCAYMFNVYIVHMHTVVHLVCKVCANLEISYLKRSTLIESSCREKKNITML